MVNVTDDFLSQEECNKFIEMIDASYTKSGLAVNSAYKDQIRNSYTSHLALNDPFVRSIQERISKKIGIPLSHGEKLQGQMYKVGQYFREHTDFFSQQAYVKNGLHSGNRQHTFMIYLNQDIKGGETSFRFLKKEFKPTTGRALDWANLKDGVRLPLSLHEGKSIEEGVKYIITSWWRERPWNPKEDARLYKEKMDNT